jgi:glycogen debranching enzyme
MRMPRVHLRPELLYAWHGHTQFIVNTHGDCGDDQALSGFYFRETRYLSTLRLSLDGRQPWLSEAAVVDRSVLHFDYVHPELHSFGGGGSDQSDDGVETDERGIPYRALDVRVRYELGIAELRVQLEMTNRAQRDVSLDVGWTLAADFADIEEAQEGRRQQQADVTRDTDGSLVRFRYQHPQLPYETRIAIAGERDWQATETGVSARVTLDTQETTAVTLTISACDFTDMPAPSDVAEREHAWQAWRDELTRIETPGTAIAGAILEQNRQDFASLPLLEGQPDEWLAMQAGMPTYPALFGRDTLTAGWQAALLDQGASLDASLTRLGRMQSDRFDAWHDEEPGRLPHEVRRGPLARLGVHPRGAYYGDYAGPLLFVISLAHLYSWTGEKACLAKHWDTARRALDWAREHGDVDGDGYLEYLTRSSDGTKNQGWKDSGNAILYEDGTPVPDPLGTCELQGYWFAAQQLFAVMSWVMGERESARAYWRSAMDLKARFDRDWWVDGDQCIALAMDPDKRLVRACTSNAGHCLATGIVSDERLPPLVGRLFAPDMFSGWGIRTLSTEHASYNPISYHLGTVWAVENATIVFGLRRFGFDARAVELSRSLFDLAALYPDYRIPECVGGYARGERPTPGAYPRANTPQLWNASVFGLLVHSLLGLQPVAPLDLLVVDPVLPTWLPEVILRDLRLGGATATLRFWRGDDGDSHAEVLHQRGTFHLVKQPPPESLASGVRDRLGAFVDGVWHR